MLDQGRCGFDAGQWAGKTRLYIGDHRIGQAPIDRLIAIAAYQYLLHPRTQPVNHMGHQGAAAPIDQPFVHTTEALPPAAGQYDCSNLVSHGGSVSVD